MIRLGIVGSNFGRNVLLPAFRTDPRCEVTGLAGGDPAKTAKLAAENGIAQAYEQWTSLVDAKDIDAVAIAVPPVLQPEIAIRALDRKKPVFLEKPLASNIDDAEHMLKAAKASKRPVMIDFEFPELAAWRRAKEIVDARALGSLRHVVVSWQVENYATRMRLKSWKTDGDEGGGALGNFVSHCFYYLEHFCGPIAHLSAQLSGLPDEKKPSESIVGITGTFASGAALSLSMSAASFLGSGHRIEFYGEDGTLVLSNTGADYMRGFELLHAKRPSDALEKIVVPDPDLDKYSDGRIAPVARLASRFIDAIESNTRPLPGLAEGYRVQQLIEAARLSHDIAESVAVEDL